MTRNTWHILNEDGALTMARRVPVRFDLGVTTHLPGGDRLRLAQQVRQDVWRALQNLRGFAPAIRVAECANGLEITAGGQVDGVIPRKAAEARIAEVLENPANRARWQRWAS
ncbi:hypothetical protein [Roseovarius sp. 2305UL8-3]|uniref:hypothetical protein n=1 Tax=Roseovarius conchicola TaxID=3121636 RepID=UPI0035274B2D